MAQVQPRGLPELEGSREHKVGRTGHLREQHRTESKLQTEICRESHPSAWLSSISARVRASPGCFSTTAQNRALTAQTVWLSKPRRALSTERNGQLLAHVRLRGERQNILLLTQDPGKGVPSHSCLTSFWRSHPVPEGERKKRKAYKLEREEVKLFI